MLSEQCAVDLNDTFTPVDFRGHGVLVWSARSTGMDIRNTQDRHVEENARHAWDRASLGCSASIEWTTVKTTAEVGQREGSEAGRAGYESTRRGHRDSWAVKRPTRSWFSSASAIT